jgi:hypothetical protein
MKTNAQQINAIANLATPKPFDAIQQTYFLGVEIVGFNNASDKLIDLQKTIDDTKIEKGTRKKAIDLLLKELWTNNVKMIESTGKSKCPIRLELKRVLDTSNLADTTKNNIVTAVAFALKHKKPYDIHAPTKYNAALKAEKEKEKLKNEILKGGSELKDAIPPTTPTATTPTATTPTATTPTATTPTATTPNVKGNTVTDYIKDMAILCQNAIQASEKRRMIKDDKQQVYADIIELFNEVMDTIGGLK